MMVRTGAVLICLSIFTHCILAQPRRPVVRMPGFPFRAKPTREQKEKLLPHPSDLKKYEAFLEQPRTGIFRLMPDLGCHDNTNVIKADETCLRAVPEGSYYSFREKEHTAKLLSDIRLRDDILISDGMLSQGILVNLGATELEKIVSKSDGLQFLSEFLPETQRSAAEKQFLQMVGGVKVGNFEYRKSVAVAENTTYALRVVAYKGNVFRIYRGFLFDLLDGDKRIDLTLAFRVIRKDSDGGVTLLWKEIERKESPRMTVPKRKK